jgi:choline kinase
MKIIPTNRFNFEFEIDKDSEDMIEGTWHITESDLVYEQDIVKIALERQFSDAAMIDRYEVKLYRENGFELTSDCTSGVFVAYRGGVPV